MGEIRFSISEELHKGLKQIALDRGISLKQLITDIFKRYTEVNIRDKNAVGKGEKEVKS